MFFTAPFSTLATHRKPTKSTVIPTVLTPIDTNMVLWYDMTDTSLLRGTDNNPVTYNFQPVKTIVEKRGTFYNMINMDSACASNCVKLSGFGPKNKACVTCGFTNAAYTTYATTGRIGFSAGSVPALCTNHCTVYIVYRSTTPKPAPNGTAGWLINKAVRYPGVLFSFVQNIVRYGKDGIEYNLSAPNDVRTPSDTPMILSLVINRTTRKISRYVNGTLEVSWDFEVGSENADGTGAFNICCNTAANVNYTFAEIGEILCYNAAHTVAELNNTHYYFYNKFGISVSTIT